MNRSVVSAAIVLGLAVGAAAHQDPAPTPPPTQAFDLEIISIVNRGSKFVETFEQDFSAVASEERQIQKLIRSDGRVRTQRELRSDFMLVKVGTSWMQTSFRDVLEVDHKTVRNHDDRLRRLLLSGSKTEAEQAQLIAQESTRYNIGTKRTGNSPLLPLRILHPRLTPGFRFARSSESAETGTRLTFAEFHTPSYLSFTSKGVRGDLLSHGTVDLDPETGKVYALDLLAEGPPSPMSVRIRVRYKEDAELKLLVPFEMTEEFWQPKPTEDKLIVTSTYSSFRRFTVNTTTIIKKAP